MTAAKDSLEEFCHLAFDDGISKNDPVRLGRLFREYTDVKRTPSLKKTLELVHSLGIKTEAADYLDTGGTNMMAGGVWHIHYSAKDRPATQKFDIFHELYEILYKRLAEWDIDYDPERLQRLRLCRPADRFAASVLIPPDHFQYKAQVTGCDIVALGEQLELSHQCLLIALGEHFDDLQLVGALYEFEPPAIAGTGAELKDYKATIVVKTAPARHVKQLCALQKVPTRKSHPVIGSMVCAAITGGAPLLWRSSINEEAPVVFVRPFFSIAQTSYRVLLLAVPREEFSLISAQVEKLEPLEIDGGCICPSQNKCRVNQACHWRNGGRYE